MVPQTRKTARELVKHGDVQSLSIFANQLKQAGHDVVHGIIREVSLVLAGANPGAFIDDVVMHGDGETGIIIGYDEMIMTLTQNVDPLVYQCITNSHIDAVNAYIEAPMTASTVKEEKGGPINRQQITSELIYYWMTAYHIPFECQKWHLNRLLMLIRICNAENKPPKKRSKRDLYRHHAEVNAANRKKFNSKG